MEPPARPPRISRETLQRMSGTYREPWRVSLAQCVVLAFGMIAIVALWMFA